MSQISIPNVAFYPLEEPPTRVAPELLEDAQRLPPELYVDEEHHGLVYCPDCGVMCSRMPRKQAKRKDNVDAFYFHIRGFDDVACKHRKPGKGGSSEGGGKEKKAINLVTFAGWKSLEDDEPEEDDADQKQSQKNKRVVQGGSSGKGRGLEIIFDENGNLLNSGEFRTVKRLVHLAQKTLNVFVQFDEQDAIRLGDLIVPIERAQKNITRYIGKSFLLFGKPTTIVKGTHRVFSTFHPQTIHLAGTATLVYLRSETGKPLSAGIITYFTVKLMELRLAHQLGF